MTPEYEAEYLAEIPEYADENEYLLKSSEYQTEHESILSFFCKKLVNTIFLTIDIKLVGAIINDKFSSFYSFIKILLDHWIIVSFLGLIV